MDKRITRRRALAVLAAAASLPATALASRAQPFEWRGIALGADARLVLWADEPARARAAINACVAEIERLEAIFSLYRMSSEISRLNRDGRLTAPSHDLVRLLRLSREMNHLTEGLFDPTVQPLWELYAGWYAGRPDREKPPGERIAEAQARIGIGKVRAGPGSIVCDSAARLTFNGIAQGYITDRVAELLRARGWRHVLVDLGEVRTLGAKPDDTPWQVGIRESGLTLPLADAALATSSGDALGLTRSGDITHIFNPLTGLSPAIWRSVTVRHASAAVADALSTALFAAAPEQLGRIARAQAGAGVWAVQLDDTVAGYG